MWKSRGDLGRRIPAIRATMARVSTLYLVRHGQASFMTADYDALSPLGVEQSRKLGEAWAARGIGVDALYIGPQRRHAQTAQHMREAAGRAGMLLPEPRVLDGAAELDFQLLLAEASGRVMKMFPDLPEQLSSSAADGRTARRHLMGVFFKLMEGWSRGEQRFGDLESFDAFTARVNSAMVTLMREQGRKKEVVLIGSGGPISQTIRVAMKLGPEHVIALMPLLYNGSVSTLRYTEDKLTVASFNSYWHLPSDHLTLI